jgi:serine/threonine protein phosphatase PrpC
LAQLPGTDTGINEKEEALENIMCAEAETAFHQANRFQIDNSYLTRCCVDPERVDGYDQDRAWEVLDGSDLQVALDDSDDELESAYGIEVCHLTEDSDLYELAGITKFGFRVEPAPSGRLAQDRMFVAYCGDYTLLGLVNSHGPEALGHDLARVIAEEMPYAVFRDRAFVSGDVARGLVSAFRRVHTRAIQRVDCRYTGAACTVLVLSEDKIWVAHVGDCKVVLGLPDDLPNAEEFHFHAAPLTMDHKLSVQAEFDRVLSNGGEVRRLTNDHVHRMFVEFEDLPGLLLTRSLGDRVGQTIGALHVPTVSVLERKNLPEGCFLALGSGGLWTTSSNLPLTLQVRASGRRGGSFLTGPCREGRNRS